MKRRVEFRRVLVLSRYHLRARTGHHSLSPVTDEMDGMDGRTISQGPDEVV